MDDSPGFSIIIPAHNEGQVIARTLRSLLASKLDRTLQVIVVANGCADDTAEQARAFGENVQVMDTPTGGKIHALNLGDAAARYFPRAFMDADVEVSPNLLASVVGAFERDNSARIVSPGCRHVYRGINPLLAGYYQLWRSLPYVRRDTMARGFYAIDAILRGRFDAFPQLTADDKFIRNLASPDERHVADECFTTVYMPGSFRELLKVKTRWTYGNIELAASRPDLNVNDQNPHGGAMKHLLIRPWLWIHMPAFLFVYKYAHYKARQRWATRAGAWDRADSSRSSNGK